MRRETLLTPDCSAVRGRRLLVALSGGADSVALLSMLSRAREAYGLTLFAAHLDHGIRPESAEDAAFCRALCVRLDVPFLCRRIDVPAEAARRHVGLETLARQLRYEWLRQCKAETRSDCIALAHHMDDQAETVLMHLARGAGPEGIGGMRELSGDLYRPLLRFRKAELVEYLRENGLEWREDFTNSIDDNPRNAIRAHVIPGLEKSYPQFVRAAARYARAAQIESDCLADLTREYLESHRFGDDRLSWLELDELPHRAVLRRAIRAACPEDIDWDALNALEALCGMPRGKTDIGKHWFAERTGRRLYFVPKRPLAIPPVPLCLNGETICPPLCRIAATPCAPVPIRDDPWRQVLNAAALQSAVVRTRQDGDRIRALGGGDKLLSDYFIDKKLDRPLRDAVPLVAVGNRVHWVCGLGISQEAAVKPGDSAVRLKCECDLKLYNGGKHHAQ